MLRTLKIGLLGGVLFALSGSASFAATYDVANDFSIGHNPNGVWSYGSSPIGTAGIVPYVFGAYSQKSSTIANIQGLEGWGVPVGGNHYLPGVYHNTNSTDVQAAPGVSGHISAGGVALHPGANGEYSIVRWTAPSAGTYNVSSLFTAGDTGGANVAIIENGSDPSHTNLFGFAFLGNTIGSTQPTTGSYNADINLQTGQTLDFVVGYSATKTYYYDTTELKASITAIPEPAYYQASALIGLGGIGLLRLRRRKTA